MQDIILFVGMVCIMISTSISACCRMDCLPTSFCEYNLIILTHNLLFEKHDESKHESDPERENYDLLDSKIEEHQPLLPHTTLN
jgi:hypothetical protein